MDRLTRLRILGDVGREIPKNLAMMIPSVRNWRLRSPRPTRQFAEVTEEELRQYAFSGLEMLLVHFPREKLRGATAVEIGPGDNVVQAMALLALGVAKYHAVDRFLGEVGSENARRLYRRVAGELPKLYSIPEDAIPDPNSFPQSLERGKVTLWRKGVEDFESLPLAGQADLVFSHQVGGHVASATAFVRASFAWLKPGGTAVHRIHFGPVVCWDRYANPLTFMTVNGVLWSLASSHRGISNRVRFDEYCEEFRRAGFRLTTRVLENYKSEHAEEIRPYLKDPLRQAAQESLQVALADFICAKPD
jgi:SAM-dependent methyltransferase